MGFAVEEFCRWRVFNGKSHCCWTNLHDTITTTLKPKNIYSPVPWFLYT